MALASKVHVWVVQMRLLSDLEAAKRPGSATPKRQVSTPKKSKQRGTPRSRNQTPSSSGTGARTPTAAPKSSQQRRASSQLQKTPARSKKAKRRPRGQSTSTPPRAVTTPSRRRGTKQKARKTPRRNNAARSGADILADRRSPFHQLPEAVPSQREATYGDATRTVTAGRRCSIELAVAAGAARFHAETPLPEGLTLDAFSGEISGVPVQPQGVGRCVIVASWDATHSARLPVYIEIVAQSKRKELQLSGDSTSACIGNVHARKKPTRHPHRRDALHAGAGAAAPGSGGGFVHPGPPAHGVGPVHPDPPASGGNFVPASGGGFLHPDPPASGVVPVGHGPLFPGRGGEAGLAGDPAVAFDLFDIFDWGHEAAGDGDGTAAGDLGVEQDKSDDSDEDGASRWVD